MQAQIGVDAMKYMIAGGGTGGHIYPALAIAWEIKLRENDAEILYVGTEKGLESDIARKEGLNFRTIRVHSMPRKIGIDSIKAMKELFLGLMDSKRIIKEFNPDIVIGTGGYVSGPVLYAASRKKIKTIVHEQNVFPGITNRILENFVDKVLVTFEESKKYFRHPNKITVTGNPIRGNIISINKQEAYRTLDISPNIPFVLSFGGSGGQKKLNDAMLHVIEESVLKQDMQIVHVTGKIHYDEFIHRLELENITLGKNIKVLPYLYEMLEGLNIADLVITSAGAITLAEISAIGVPSILIPKGYTAENHQEYNARVFKENGASHLILEKDLTGKGLYNAIRSIITDKARLTEMRERSKSLGKVDATKRVIDAISRLAQQ